MLNKIENEKKILLKESLDVLITRPRSNTCPLLQSTIQSKKLKLGSKVIILGTDNVEHRVPQYVGVEGLIIDVPVHPATWYKVKFIDGQIITFRPSALKLLSDSDISNHDTNDNEDINNNNNNNNNVESLQTSTKPNLPPKHSQHSTKSKVLSHNQSKNLLSNINPDLWASCKVKILSGKYNGQIALVKYSGNGWVQLDTQLGEVAKRATELELLEIRQTPNFPKPTESLTISIPVNNTSSNVRRRSNSESLVISPTSRTSIINTSPNSSNTPNTSSTSTISNSTPPNISNSNEFQSKSQLKIKPFSGNNNTGNNGNNVKNNYQNNNTKNNHNQKQDHNQHHLRQSNHNNNHSNNHNNNNNQQQPPQKIQKQQHRDSISQSYPSDIDDKDLHTVLVDPKIRNLQYDYFKKYVEKEVAKVKHRPNIKYWTNQIKSTMIDEEHERNISRVINENYCTCCQMEKWPGSIVCWNELCLSSPIYWKLPGAAGTPTIPETRYKNMESVFKDELDKFTFSSIQSNNEENNNNKLNDIEPLEKKRKIIQFDNTILPSSSSTAATTTTTTTSAMVANYDENERIACQILRSLSSLSPNQCFPNIVTEYINNSPILQVYTPSVSPSLTPSPIKTKSLMLPSPSKNTQKNERSDSGATDTEDGIRIDTIRQPLILKVKNNSNNNHNNSYNNHNHNHNNNLKNNSLFVVSESGLPSSTLSTSSTSLSTTTTTYSPNYKLVPKIHLNKNKEIQIPSQSKLIQNNHHNNINNNNSNNNNLKISVHGLKSTPIQQSSSTTATTTTTTPTITTKGIASFESSNLSQQNQLKITKKVKSPFSPTTKRGLFLAQGKPPTEEEFVKFLSEHHFPSQQISSSASFSLSSNLQHREPQPQEHLRDNQKIQKNGLETLPLSVLTSRVDSSSQRNMTEFTNVANGPPLLNSTHNTSTTQSIYPQHNKINK